MGNSTQNATTCAMSRALDLLLVALNSYFLWSCLCIERFYCAAPLSAESDGILKLTYDFSVENNPLFLARPDWLRYATCISAYGYAPFYALFVVAFLFQINKVRVPALVFVGCKLNAIAFYHIMEYTSSTPPPNPAAYWGVEGPYLLGIALILYRCVPGAPFKCQDEKVKKN